MDTYEPTDARIAAAWPMPLHAGGDWEGVNTGRAPASAPLSATAPRKRAGEYLEGKAQAFADWLAAQITAALLDEATLAPKPGLVDPRGQGAHRDMHWELMRRSALALEPSFRALAMAGYRQPAGTALRERIGALGRAAEAAMLAATAGVNTHRGAIWALGLLAVAAAQNSADVSSSAIATRAGILARLPDRHAPATTGLPGEQACLRYSVGGARGQAQAGFPQVIRHGLPMLWRSRRHGDHESAARLNALLAIMSSLDDTCVLARGGPVALQAMQAGARRVLASGGCANLAGRRELHRLDRLLLELNVSPGGAADLLAATLFLDRMARRSDESRNPAMPAFDQGSG